MIHTLVLYKLIRSLRCTYTNIVKCTPDRFHRHKHAAKNNLVRFYFETAELNFHTLRKHKKLHQFSTAYAARHTQKFSDETITQTLFFPSTDYRKRVANTIKIFAEFEDEKFTIESNLLFKNTLNSLFGRGTHFRDYRVKKMYCDDVKIGDRFYRNIRMELSSKYTL